MYTHVLWVDANGETISMRKGDYAHFGKNTYFSMYGSTKYEQEDMESLTTEYKVLRRLRRVDTRGDGTKIHVLSWNLSIAVSCIVERIFGQLTSY